MTVLLSQAFVASEFCVREVEAAAHRRIPIFVLAHKPAAPDLVPRAIRDISWGPFSNPTEVEQTVKDLVDALRTSPRPG